MADVITRLKLESGEYDSKIKRATQGLLQMETECRKVGGTLAVLEKDQLEFVKSLGKMETVSTSVRGKLGELTQAYTELAVQYKRLTNEEKNGDFGKALNASLQQLKGRINETKNQLADVNKELNMSGGKFGEFGNIIDTIGSKFGVSGNLTEMLTSKTAMLTGAVGAGIAIVTKATEAWAGYNAELAKQDQITTVTTGLKGDAADQMTNQARALVDTYNVDFREAINAANTLMTQFGESGEQAMQLIKDGMQGMIQGDGPKLLSMIQQYAPAFRDAGVSASQLVAVIQNSEGGIFTDQNMNAIVMGIKNIRLMTKATSDALAQLGIDGQKMSKQLSDGSMTIFDALKQVAGAISNVDSNSQAAGEVMQQVFGRQGAMAGTKLGEAIATLNTNLEETKKQTGEVGEVFNDLYEANLRLNTAIRDAFGYDGWEQMATGIKTTLIGALSDVIEHLAIIRQGFKDIANFFGGGNKTPAGKGYEDVEKTQQWINNGKDDNERRRRYEKVIADLQNKLNNVGKEYAKRNADGSTSFIIDDAKTQAKKRDALQKRMSMLYATSYTPKPEPIINTNFKVSGSGGKGGKTTNQPTYDKGSLADQQAEVQRLTKLWQESGETIRDQYLQPLVEAEKKLQEMKDLMGMQKDLAMGKFSGKGSEDFKQSMRDAKGLSEGIEEKNHMLLDDKALAKAFAEAQKKPKKKEEKEEKKYMSDGMSHLSGGLGGLQSGFAQLGIDLGDGFGSVVQGLQGITTILMAIQTIVGAIEVISAADSIIPFAGGGIVKAAGGTLVGNSYSGDNLRGIDPSGQLYGLNAGEVVLNRSQVGNLASQLSGGGMQNMKLDAVITGEQIRLVLNNNGRRTGRGEYVQTKSGRV